MLCVFPCVCTGTAPANPYRALSHNRLCDSLGDFSLAQTRNPLFSQWTMTSNVFELVGALQNDISRQNSTACSRMQAQAKIEVALQLSAGLIDYPTRIVGMPPSPQRLPLKQAPVMPSSARMGARSLVGACGTTPPGQDRSTTEKDCTGAIPWSNPLNAEGLARGLSRIVRHFH